ncbi:M1 family aminopeptidase [Flavobacterium sp.]|uniref:M1 family aminopeptidase n=1 Tax=Flavobacterium sp. TaxID=239 RepID=UPI003752D2EE
MKKSYFILFILSISFSFGQNHRKEFDDMITSEMHSASRLLNVVVNPNTLNYDITYHKLEFTVNPAIYFISGKVTTTFTALANMNTVTFDLANPIVVSSVKKNNTNLTFVQNGNNELVITLPTSLSIGSSETVEIIYSGQPPVSGFSAFASQTHNGTPVLWTLSEPFGARDWWPCKQDLNDKINSIDVYITAPSQYVAVSNGVEPEAPILNGTNKTTHFHHGYPIPAYLICMAVTNYTVYTQTAGSGANTYPIVNYIYPENFTPAVQEQLNQTPLILDFFSNLFELYPFRNEKYGHAQFGWGGGMEHTTVSFMNNFNRGLIAHEMAHQWFGDKITCGTWKDIWLNEGFATYLAALVIENFDGAEAFVAEKEYMIGNITSQTGGNVYLTDTQAANVNRIFSGRLTYNKGAMVLNMLRFKLGDAVFFQGVRNYLADTNLAYKYAITSDFKSHMELTSGLDLTEFFNDWIINQGYPTYLITAQNFGTGQAKITVNQTQSNASVSYFEMPVPVRLYDVNGNFLDVIVENTFDGQEFIVNVPFQVVDVIFDVNQNIISKNNTFTLTNSAFELENAITVFPNPAFNELNIQVPSDLEVQNIIVFNCLGQKVLESTKLNFSVSQLSTGIHFVDIVTDKGVFHKKIIKK